MTKKLSDSMIYKEYNSRILNAMKSINPVTDAVPKEKLEEQLTFINKKFNFATKNKIMNYLNKGDIIIVMNDTYVLPRFLNVFGKKVNNKPVVLVDISAYTTINKTTGALSIYPKTLYALLQNAMVLLEITKNPNKFLTNDNLILNSTVSYTKLVCQVLDKMLGINISDTKSDIFHFLVAKFFLKNVVEYNTSEDNINIIARKTTVNNTSLEFLLDNESMLETNTEELYVDIFTFLKKLKSLEGAGSLNGRSFIEQYLRMYGEASMLSLDYFPSFISMVLGTNVSAQINKDYIIDSVASRSNTKITMEFSKLI